MKISMIMSALKSLLVTLFREQAAMAAQVETFQEIPGGIESCS